MYTEIQHQSLPSIPDIKRSQLYRLTETVSALIVAVSTGGDVLANSEVRCLHFVRREVQNGRTTGTSTRQSDCA